jgi:hypothetical protein
MSNGLFQNLPGSHEMAGIQALPTEPWLLPISDRAAEAAGKTADELQAAVRRAARPFWLATGCASRWVSPSRSNAPPAGGRRPPAAP